MTRHTLALQQLTPNSQIFSILQPNEQKSPFDSQLSFLVFYCCTSHKEAEYLKHDYCLHKIEAQCDQAPKEHLSESMQYNSADIFHINLTTLYLKNDPKPLLFAHA